MDKRIRPFEDIAPLNVSINLFISSFDSIAETTMDFGLTFIMRFVVNFTRVLVKFQTALAGPAHDVPRHHKRENV